MGNDSSIKKLFLHNDTWLMLFYYLKCSLFVDLLNSAKTFYTSLIVYILNQML